MKQKPLQFEDWRSLAWICAFPGLILIPLMLYLPETPYYLIEKDKNTEAG